MTPADPDQATRPSVRTSILRRTLSALAAVAGVAVVVVLVRAIGARAIGALILRAGWWLPLVIALHTPQTLCSALGWRSLSGPAERPGAGRFYLWRWVRESVNGLLPVAQVGGDVVRARLLARAGASLSAATASCVLDVALELAAQVVFTAIGIELLIAAGGDAPVVRLAVVAILVLGAAAAGLIAVFRAPRHGRLRSLLAALAHRSGLGRFLSPAAAGRGAFRPTRTQALRCTLWHLLSWLLGALETFAAFRALGLPAGFREAVTVESLAQVVRAAGFAVPGALGVQEGGLVLVCGLFGVAPAGALALSLLRRIRELALGAPGLAVWHWIETRERPGT